MQWPGGAAAIRDYNYDYVSYTPLRPPLRQGCQAASVQGCLRPEREVRMASSCGRSTRIPRRAGRGPGWRICSADDCDRRRALPYVEYEFGESSVMGDESSVANWREFRPGGRELWRENCESAIAGSDHSGANRREWRRGDQPLWHEFGDSAVMGTSTLPMRAEAPRRRRKRKREFCYKTARFLTCAKSVKWRDGRK